ncbi:glycoside hydrolase family 27 protein [Aestuariimicrobium kwangyangense]|uniref:glycoside hydrolase family 27 protein n=1 Tax=Aestuariimicrobium kwangyangense TaxID=396389 RepID=UPI0003B4344A|nr:glycoside hydrolase family 27 protein [Aestuariimicrobium kwangyangense]
MPLAACPTPPMGWNSWNAFRTRIDEQQIVSMADVIVSTGLRDAGYQYLVVDDGWQAPRRSSGGNLQPDPARFGQGIDWLADQVHQRGLKLGMYLAPGRATCAMIYDAYPGEGLGSFGHEADDLAAYAEWGVDYLKYDWCEACRDDTGLSYRGAFEKMGQLIADSPREFVYSISEYGRTNPWEWAPGLANLWRTTPDIDPSFSSVRGIADAQRGLERWSRPGAWNDPDMLQVGNPGLTLAECRAHLGLWALLAAPLMAGNDIRTMNRSVAQVLTNPRLVAIDQDPLGRQGRRIQREFRFDVWLRELSGGRVAVGVLGSGERASEPTTQPLRVQVGDGLVRVDNGTENVIEIGHDGPVTEVWSGEATSEVAIGARDLALFTIG